MLWDAFLQRVADTHDLFEEDERQAFLVRFNERNLPRSDIQVAQDLNISEVTLQRRLGKGVYTHLVTSCPQLHTDKKGKFKIVRDWLKKGYILCQGDGKGGIKETAFPHPSPIANHLYVERPQIESLCYQTLLEPGALIRIKAPRQMGKTELMAKLLNSAQQQGYHRVYLNLCKPEESVVQDLDQFLRWFCISISRQLQKPLQLQDYWDVDLSSNDNCSAYFQDYLLEQIDRPLVLGLDTVDRLFTHLPIAQDFFGMLRAWHEDSKIIDNWQKLRLIVSHSTEAYIPLDINHSPFNVGRTISLSEFTAEQVTELAQQHKQVLSQQDVTLLINRVGGHPGLIKKALVELQPLGTMTLTQLLNEAATESGIYGSYLRNIWRELQDNPALIPALKKVVDTNNDVELASKLAYQLESLGLVHLTRNKVTIRCELYRDYFGSRLANFGEGS
ncbi:MAG: AAA-like domain-containing protein [Coleofasciculus sp. A1-SPW-01]|uniref:AAA-like domain-containing protein n=1 Tax=Coleofasciculus TaxID=669368 RepID=UPI0002FC5705|nr:AAA-like domain-containing protein [Coleofasciculus chthonoplastes]